MKYFFFLIAVVALSFTSCKKCATCTFTEADGNVLTSDFCESPRLYENTLRVHERTNWKCEEN